ncbi:MAG: hypothetical protein ACE5GQ_04110 [Nitrospinales bacterium]
MKTVSASSAAFAIGLAMILFCTSPVSAKTKITDPSKKWITVGYGLKASYSSIEDAAPSGTNRLNDFSVQNVRLYLHSELAKGINLTFNTDYNPNTNNVVVMDAAAKFRFANWFNVWGGRFHIPSDRTNHSGPYNLNAWDLPFVQRIPNIAFGRDNGAAFWGTTFSQKLKYEFGVFRGRVNGTNSQTNPNRESHPLFAGKVQYNFWDPEPGYGNKNSYFGKKDILAVAFVWWHQDDGAGNLQKAGHYTHWSADFLLEKKLSNKSVVTLDFTYYDYDLDGASDVKLIDGQAYYVSLNYLLSGKVGWGQFQPYVRYQEFNRANFNRLGQRGQRNRIEGGVNYIIDGHNAKLALFYYNEHPGPGGGEINAVKVGAQLQF